MSELYNILFDDFTFDAAVLYFGEKLPLTPKSYKILSQKHRRGAFTVAAYTQAVVVEQFYNRLLDAMEEGSTVAEFRSSMNTFLKDNGYEGISRFYADNIFRTNIQTAYQVGHYEEMTEPEVLKYRPYWQYDAVGDARTRPSHMALDGKVFPAGSPVWDTWYPPNGYRCRCTVTTLSKRQVEQRGLKISEKVPDTVMVRGRPMDVTVDPDFDYNPAKKEWRPDVGSAPKAIREAYKEKVKDGH